MPPLTGSIVAHDLAVAIATRAFAVGAHCPSVRAGVGAVATQSITNRDLGPAILDLIARGIAPATAIDRALAADEGRQLRQVHVVDRLGRAAVWTGRHCVDTCGDRTTAHVSVAGNMLGGGAVIAETFDAFAAGSDLPLPQRLLAALQAGERAGGDRRGKQSAALLLTTTEDFADLKIRIDTAGRTWPLACHLAPAMAGTGRLGAEQGQSLGPHGPRYHRGRLEGARSRSSLSPLANARL